MFFTTVPFSVNDTREKGFVLISSLMLVGLLIILGVTAITMTNLEMETDANLYASTQSFYLAQAGIERALGKLAADSTWAANVSDPSNAFSGDNSLGAESYVVEVFNDNSNTGDVRIRSTGSTSGYNAGSAALEAVGTKGGAPPVFDWALFGCGNYALTDGENDIHDGDVYVSGNLDMGGNGNNKIEDGDIHVGGNVTIDKGWVRPGDVFANSNVELNASFNPNVDGNVTAGGNVTGSGNVTGTITANVTPLPVTDLCTGPQLAAQAITAEDIQDYRDNADTNHCWRLQSKWRQRHLFGCGPRHGKHGRVGEHDAHGRCGLCGRWQCGDLDSRQVAELSFRIHRDLFGAYRKYEPQG